jgi:hypothetical protein
MIDKQPHSLLGASHKVMPTKEYIYSIQDQTEMEHLIDRLKRLRKLYLHDANLHKEIDDLYNTAIGHDYHLHRIRTNPQTTNPLLKAVQLLNGLIEKAGDSGSEGSFRGGDPEELQRKREEKRTDAIESGQAEEQQVDAGDEAESADPSEAQEAQEKAEEKEQAKSMGVDILNGVGIGQHSAEVSPVDTFGDYNPRNANGDPVDLKAHAQDYLPPGPPRQGENQHKDWSEVIGIKVPMTSTIQDLRRFYARGDGVGADRASKMMPKSMLESMMNKAGGNVAPSGAEGRARGGKYVKREFQNGRWEYTYQDDMHPNHGPGNLNNPDGHTLEVHPEFKDGSPEDAFNHSLHMQVAEGGTFPTKMWDDDQNKHVDKVLHFPGSKKDENGKFEVDPKTNLPKLHPKNPIIIRDPGQEKGGEAVSTISALHKKMSPVLTIKDAYGDPWVHVKAPVSSGKSREDAKRPQAGAPLLKYDTRSRFTHPDDTSRGSKGWLQKKYKSLNDLVQDLEGKRGVQEFLKQESERGGGTSLSDRKKAKEWDPTYHEVWDPITQTKKRDAEGNPVTEEMKTTNAIERGDMGTWKWSNEDRGYEAKPSSEYGKTRHYVKRGTHLDFDSHHDRREVMDQLRHENYSRLFGAAMGIAKQYGLFKNKTPDQIRNMTDELINEGFSAFHDAVDSYNPNKGARLSTHLVNRVKGKMREYVPEIIGGEEGEKIKETRRAARGFRPKPEFGSSGHTESSSVGAEREGGYRPEEDEDYNYDSPDLGSPEQMDPFEALAAKEEVQKKPTTVSKESQGQGKSNKLPVDQLLRRMQTLEHAGSGLVHVPAVVSAFSPKFDRKAVHDALLDAERNSLIELRPETSFDLLSPEEKKNSIPGVRGSLLSHARIRGAQKSIVDAAASVLFKGMDDEEQEEAMPQPKYLWREGEPGAYKYMWEDHGGDVVRMTNAPSGHPHEDPEAGDPVLHPSEPTPETAPQMFNKQGQKLHSPVPDGVESEDNESYDPDVNNWSSHYQDPETGEDEYTYLHKDKVKDHRMKFNEDLRYMDAQLEKVRQWYKQLLTAQDPVHRAVGLAVAFLDQAKMVSDGTDSGILSLKVGDVKPSGNTVYFTYRDASGKPHHVQTVLDGVVSSALQELMQGKKPSDPLFMINGQQLEQPMLAKVFDDQFGLNLNQLRVFHGTELFSKEFQNLAASTPNLKPEDLPKLANKAYARVARMMGHVTSSPKLAQQLYVDPIVVEALYMSAIHHHHPDFNKSHSVATPDQKVDERTSGESIGVVGKMTFQGIPISIENPVGSLRKWHDKTTGERGQTKMLYPYGFIRHTEGLDHGEVDVYVGPHRNSEKVFVIHQMKGPTFKDYDEDKCMLGFRTSEAAKEAYLKHYDDPRFYGSMTEMSMREFKNKVFSTKKHPHMVTTDKIPGGLAEGKPDTDFDPDDVLEGIKVEMEHTNDPSIAYEITKDHLTENKNYYKHLKKMERKMEKSHPFHAEIVRHFNERRRLHSMVPKEHQDEQGLPRASSPTAHLREPIEAHQYAEHLYGVLTRKPHLLGEANEASKHAWKQSEKFPSVGNTEQKMEKSVGQKQLDPLVWHVSVSCPDRTAEEEAFGKWVHSHPMHEHDQQWAAFKQATNIPDVPIPDPQREYADGSKQLLDNVEDNPEMEQEEDEPPPMEQNPNQVAKSMLDDLMERVA